MQISTVTALLSDAKDDDRLIPAAEAVQRLSSHGYKVLDISLAAFRHKDFILRGDDWQKQIDAVAEEAAKCGVTFSQSHLPFYAKHTRIDPFFKTPESIEYFDECMRRAYIASGMLGVRYATAHPLTDIDNNYSINASFNFTHAYFDKYVELGIKNGVGTAFENLFTPFDRVVTMLYCQNYEDLINLVDSFNDDMVGICWDFGHANIMKYDQTKALRAVGKRLKNLHINDNSGGRDEHLLPFLGTVDWRKIIPVLKEVGFDGDLTFETGQMTRKAERGIQDLYIDATYKCGEYLLKMYQEC